MPGEQYSVCWRILDAQYAGVPQRRRRVFIAASLGNGRCAQVLFEPESLPGDTPPSRETRAAVAADVTARAGAGVAVYAIAERTRNGSPNLEVQKDLSYSLTNPGSGGRPASRLIAFAHQAGGDTGLNINEELSGTLQENQTMAVAFGGNNTAGADDNDAQGNHLVVAETLNSGGNDGGFRTEPRAHLIAADVAPTLQKESYSPTKTSTGQALDWCITNPGLGVRRLTPTECLRLQGFPDSWAAGQSDSARYRQLGNAVAVPVAEWIGRQLMTAEKIKQ